MREEENCLLLSSSLLSRRGSMTQPSGVALQQDKTLTITQAATQMGNGSVAGFSRSRIKMATGCQFIYGTEQKRRRKKKKNKNAKNINCHPHEGSAWRRFSPIFSTGNGPVSSRFNFILLKKKGNGKEGRKEGNDGGYGETRAVYLSRGFFFPSWTLHWGDKTETMRTTWRQLDTRNIPMFIHSLLPSLPSTPSPLRTI